MPSMDLPAFKNMCDARSRELFGCNTPERRLNELYNAYAQAEDFMKEKCSEIILTAQDGHLKMKLRFSE